MSTAKPLATRRSSLLFTHFGLSGPAAMDVSRQITREGRLATHLQCDFLPAFDQQQLIAEFTQAEGQRRVSNLVGQWLPQRLVESLLREANVPLDRTAAEFSKAERQRLIACLKRCRFDVTGSLGFAKAEVTTGGVSIDEVDSRDMQSRCQKGLYLIGEVLDIDGPIGGYNFQAAFSTGWLAGCSV